jgi:carboxyl-terminal processing protease
MDDSPSFKAGVKAGDIIMEIDGKSLRRLDLGECVKMLKGPPGSVVSLKIYRRGDDSTKDFKLERAMISVSPVKNSKLLEGDIGYVRITQFSMKTAEELDAALRKLRQNAKLKGLVIDLRGNPGGLLDAAVKVCSRFLAKGELVVSTEGRKQEDKREYRSVACEKTLDLPIAILVNGYSASASEIVSGCLQDHKRAVIVGTRSFGKGLVQTVVPMPDGGAIRLTTAKYYTPKRQMIQGHGIDPDIKVEISRATEAAIAQEMANEGLPAKPGAKPPKDVQLERATEILKGVSLFREAKVK